MPGAAVLALSSIAHGGKCRFHSLVLGQRTLAGHPPSQMGCDQKSAQDVAKAQGNTGAPHGQCFGDQEGNGEGLAEKTVNREW